VLVSALTGITANLLGPFSGVVAFLLGIAIITALVILGMAWLPSKPVPVYAHLPGAIVLALVIQGLGAVGEFFIANQLASSEALYGVLGLAGTLLFVLYMIGRTTVWACERNAITWDVWFGDSEPPRAAPIRTPARPGPATGGSTASDQEVRH